MYADPKRIRQNRVPVYLDDYVHDRLQRLVELTGGEKSVVSRGALERGLDLLERELHGAESAQDRSNKPGLNGGYVCA